MIKTISALFQRRNPRATNPYPGSKVDEKYPARPELALDQKDMISRMNHRQLLNSTRHIYNAFPMVSGAINDIANHTIGHHWQPQHKGKDVEFAGYAEEWLNNWAKVADVRGHPFTLTLDFSIAVVSLCRDGEFFIHPTKGRSGFPMLQFLESHRIGDRAGYESVVVVGGRFDGSPQRNGIAYNEYSRPIAYHYLADDPADDEWIPAENIWHVYDPKWFSQGRGISPLVYGILDWLDVQGWRDNEKMAQVVLSSIAAIEANDEGAPTGLSARLQAAATGATGTAPAKPAVESFFTGAIRYIKLNGQNIKAFEQNRPSMNQADFEARVLRGCFRALGWTYEQALDSKSQGGANVRRDVAQNQKSIEHWQGVLRHPWHLCVTYALASALSMGLLTDEAGDPLAVPTDWYKWRPQLPQKMTVDHGRDRKTDLDEIRAGARTMIEDIRDRGLDETEHLHEQVNFYNLKKEIAERSGIPREEWTEVFGTLLINPAAQPLPKPEPVADE
jgi:capsid protein